MHLANSPVTRLSIFCKVVDNYGDIGICWRLARQLAHEHILQVELWVDDLQSFRRICPEVDMHAAHQMVQGIQIRHWQSQEGQFSTEQIADIVIEFFACDIPPGYIQAMAQCEPRPVWLNLEGLTAEEWVEGCHTLPSPHPSLPITKHFFFPGFNIKTGGLLCEAEIAPQRSHFQSDTAHSTLFLRELGLTAEEIAAQKISLFCYPHAPVAALLEAWQQQEQAIALLVPEGVAQTEISAFLGQPARAGIQLRRGALSVRVLPFIPQPDYDRLLWACDINFVRGEDSFVRAQWACRPFIWHIYPQDENLHHKKLRAFLSTHQPSLPAAQALTLAWNGVTQGDMQWQDLWRDFSASLSDISKLSPDWQRKMAEIGDLATNLLQFAHAQAQDRRQK
ncbi:elongation factor P maturation arginine rhamnosyltransferase EarP [Undibacterium sp. CY7W]|uniref:Protein-arginine rhamnosyltransferase n=1 Tax=Undibacterium rugosum TaxID=2762291 RepID=A0A923HYF5_9BURK|nr:elongation factor P maturation arginine rhamnosyltransferase EarP [Undibacterium rugosum]MBC3934478.1 elongation factor P maturation arginine rhamnosyltransferase EarP [Undibacterium rugosum]